MNTVLVCTYTYVYSYNTLKVMKAFVLATTCTCTCNYSFQLSLYHFTHMYLGSGGLWSDPSHSPRGWSLHTMLPQLLGYPLVVASRGQKQ